MDNEHVSPERDDEALADTTSEELLDRLISDEMGEKIAQIMRSARRAQEAWHRSRNPDEGLRERKRRLTRQLISDAATTMFATRGFDNVKVSEVADRVGVSEKTIYNYFPTKESLVLDTADEAVERMARALRERGPDESLTAAVVRAIRGGHGALRPGARRAHRVHPAVPGNDRQHPGPARGVAGDARPAGQRRPRRAGGAGRHRPARPRADRRRPRAGGPGRGGARVARPPHPRGPARRGAAARASTTTWSARRGCSRRGCGRSACPAASGPSSRRWRPPGRRTTPAPRCSRRCARRARRGPRCDARAAAGTPGPCARRSSSTSARPSDRGRAADPAQAQRQPRPRQAHAQRQARDARRGGGRP